jgi:hypothetical protein
MQQVQQLLDIAALIPPAIAVLMFLGYCWQRSAPIQPTRTDQFLRLVEAKFVEVDVQQALNRLAELQLIEEVLEACQPEPCDQGATRPVTTITNPDRLNSQQLRQECRKLGIKWRNAHGEGKHLTRPEMLNAIGMAIA